jgi:hypothetical protein
MANLALVSKTLKTLIEPAVRSRADRLYVLTGGRPGSQKRKPTMANYYETGLVVALYEFLLMAPDLAHMEICHERGYRGRTKPEQVDLSIQPVNGGRVTLVECGDFSPKKLKDDVCKMRRLNPKGANWFLAFFRNPDTASDPWKKIKECRGRKRSLKGVHIDLAEKFCGHFKIELPNSCIFFGYALIKAK